MGSVVFLPIIFLPVVVFFNTLDKLWILFLYVVETFVIVSGWWSDWIFSRSSGLPQLVMNIIGDFEVHECNMRTTRWGDFFHSLTINPKDFDSDQTVSHKSTVDRLSKGNHIRSSLVNNDLVHLQKYRE